MCLFFPSFVSSCLYLCQGIDWFRFRYVDLEMSAWILGHRPPAPKFPGVDSFGTLPALHFMVFCCIANSHHREVEESRLLSYHDLVIFSRFIMISDYLVTWYVTVARSLFCFDSDSVSWCWSTVCRHGDSNSFLVSKSEPSESWKGIALEILVAAVKSIRAEMRGRTWKKL